MTTPTYLSHDARLPLTCTRAGTCCHGKLVWINPWELASLAQARALSAQEFRAQCTLSGGIRLLFDGAAGWRGLPACSQYDGASGCRVHAARPLACRFYPIARDRRGSEVRYVHDGDRFPCLEGCPTVIEGAHLTIAEYLAQQDVAAGIVAQDAYVELVHDLAEGALVLLLDSGLSRSGDRKTLPRWRAIAASQTERISAIDARWLDRLLTPALPVSVADPAAFVAAHAALLQTCAQDELSAPTDIDQCREAACLMFSLALHLSESNGMMPSELADEWIRTAKKNGAQER
jgi:uncharacterized protein